MLPRVVCRLLAGVLAHVALSRECRKGRCGSCDSPACDHDCHPWITMTGY